MATKIRLQRGGKKNKPVYRIVVADARAPRDGKYIEKLGTYNPNVTPDILLINVESATKWVLSGAEPTDTARKLLSESGVMLMKHLQVGVNKGAITQEDADKKFDAWKTEKDAKAQALLSEAEKAAAAAVKALADEREKIKSELVAAKAKAEADAIAAEEAAKAEAEAEAKAAEAPEEVVAEEAAPEVEASTEEAKSEEK